MQFQEEQDYTKKLDLGLWGRLFRHIRPFYGLLALVLCSMFLNALIDAQFPLMTKEAIDTFFIAGADWGAFRGFVVRYMLLVLANTAVLLIFFFGSFRLEFGVDHHIRRIGFAHLQTLSFSYYDTMSVGSLIARLTNDTNRLGETVSWLLDDTVYCSFYIIVVCINMFRLSWRLALVAMAVMACIAVVAVIFQRSILHSYRIVRRTGSQITSAFNEGISGAKTSKTLVREEANTQEFRDLTGKMRHYSVRAGTLSALFMPIVTSLGSLLIVYVLWKGGADVCHAEAALSIGTLTAFVNYAMNILDPLGQVARLFADMQSSQAAAERVVTLLETQPDVVDRPDVIEKFGDSFHPKRENWPEIHGDITFDHVDFRYKKGEKVLSDFNLHISAGETIALVGETGGGKSTIVNLVCRFYEPTAGRILIDGVDYRERSQLWLQSGLGYVLQQPHLFSGTIRENIRYGRLDATDAEVERAARLVDAEDFILKFEKGYDTDVGEGGNRLSVGQKQLISFARALLADPAIFVLDEATSSVDTETEMKIQSAIEMALKGRTSFIIAHRLSTIRMADRILVIRKGKITEMGTHEELLAQRGYYYDLYTNQFKDEATAAALK